MKLRVRYPILVKIFLSLFFALNSFSLFSQSIIRSEANYLNLTKGLPIEFGYTLNSEALEGVLLQDSITYKSIKPIHVSDNGNKWFARFYFTEQVYVSEIAAKKAFEDLINEFTGDKRMIVKCPYYTVREKTKIFSLATACNFHWKIELLVNNLKKYFVTEENALSVAIKCESGGSCKILSGVNQSKQ